MDNAATTPYSRKVIKAMLPFYNKKFGNPESTHAVGTLAFTEVFVARKKVARLFGEHAYAKNIIFTSGGTEANNLAILGAAKRLSSLGKTHMITSMTEHKSVLEAFRRLENEGFTVTYLEPGRKGYIAANQVMEAIRESTGLVSIMYVNNETGCINETELIGRHLSKLPGILLFHVDCVQAAGCFDLSRIYRYADMISVSAHKIHGPKGIGCLCVKHSQMLEPIMAGGEQELFLRPGTLNVPAIIGFGSAAEEAGKLFLWNLNRVSTLEEVLTNKLTKTVPGFHKNFDKPDYCGKVVSYRFDGVDAQTLAEALSIKDVFVSTGAACNSNSSEPSYVLLASGLSPDEAASTIRVSFSPQNTVRQMNKAAKAISDCVSFLRSMNLEGGE